MEPAAETDREAYFVELTGSTFTGTAGVALFNSIDTKFAAGDAAAGKGFIIVDNGTDTKILFDPDFSAASNGSLIEIATITGLADGSTIDDAVDNPALLIVPCTGPPGPVVGFMRPDLSWPLVSYRLVLTLALLLPISVAMADVTGRVI